MRGRGYGRGGARGAVASEAGAGERARSQAAELPVRLARLRAVTSRSGTTVHACVPFIRPRYLFSGCCLPERPIAVVSLNVESWWMANTASELTTNIGK